MNDAAHPSDIEFGGETVEVLQSLWDAGERERAVAWARNVLSNERASLPFKVRTAGLLQSWGELKNEITILDALRDRPEQLLVAGRFGDVGAYLSLLGARDGEEAAQQSYAGMLRRLANEPTRELLDALNSGYTAVRWQPGWADLLAQAAEHAQTPADLRCTLVARLENIVQRLNL